MPCSGSPPDPRRCRSGAALAGARRSTCRACAASRSTSTSGCPPVTRRATARSSRARSSSRSASTPSLVRVPGDDGGPIEGAGERYERAIVAAGGVDLQVLGIGRTGHIGFNEPGSSLASLHPGQDPHRADPRRQRALLRLARRRAAALPHAGARHDPARPAPGAARVRRGEGGGRRRRASRVRSRRRCRARSIQLHPSVTVIVDEAAASQLRFARLLPLRLGQPARPRALAVSSRARSSRAAALTIERTTMGCASRTGTK